MKHDYRYYHGLSICSRCKFVKPLQGSQRSEAPCTMSDTSQAPNRAQRASEGVLESA